MKKTLLFALCCITVLSIFLVGPLQISVEAYDSPIPVSYGTSITLYEKTTNVYIHNFSVSVLMGTGGNFKGAPLENYTVTSDGTYLKIHCFRDRLLSGHAVGNNIVAVMLNGVLGFPDGLWASVIVNHTLGHNGIAESRFNALGSDTKIGPYAPAPEYGLCTYMGDQDSELVLGFTAPTHTLTIYSSPTEVTFAVNNSSHTTPWSEDYPEGTSVSLVMPETHTVGDAKYYWDQWSDGNTSRSRTVTMNSNITLIAYYTGPYYELTVTSIPVTGIPFTINGTTQTTTYTEWLLEGSYTLIMPETHNGYIWSHWLEDGDPNRIKTILLQGTTWTAVYEPAPPPVGGKATPINIPMNSPDILTPFIGITTLLAVAVVTIIYVKKRKRNTEINS